MDTPKESASSLTGRKLSEPEIQFLKPPELPTYLREIMDLLAKEVTVTAGLDLAHRPDSLGAMLVRYVDGKMEVEHLTGIQGKKADLLIIDEFSLVSDGSTIEKDMLAALDFFEIEQRALALMGGSDVYPLALGGPSLGKKRFQHGFFEVDYDPDEMRRQRMKPDIKKLAKAKKDKSYLALDPTKNHRKRRR